jgi:hypothetical protein
MSIANLVSWLSQDHRDVRVRDARADGVAVAAARHAPHDVVAVPDGLRAERDRARVVEDDADELLPRLRMLERLRPTKSPLSIFTAKPRPASNGVVSAVRSVAQAR